MLLLKNIRKSYVSGNTAVNALDGVSLAFRKNEFVAILGPSGSGKTTLLNIIGGLDQYTEGDLIINGTSTKKYKDKDWDTYRNHSVGFVFQSYNLIPHQSVLSNVELALTLSGVSKKERRKRARVALERVGLGDQLNKRPNQMSGGQMQRVAIARALVNNPDILLADEPTGALDSATSVQIMDLLKEVSNDRLVIMVTHNPELADMYANRIVRLKDGVITDDTNPFDGVEEEDTHKKVKKPSMSLFTALSLSLNNLLTKKARTFLTSFAGSIGIIGIAMILALSSGVNAYINQVQEETLSSYPIQIEAEQLDMSSIISGLMDSQKKSEEHSLDKVYASPVMYDLVNTMNNSETIKNDLNKLKKHFEDNKEQLGEYARAVHYRYDIPLNIYAKNSKGDYQKADIMEAFSSLNSGSSSQMSSTSTMGQLSSGFMGYNTWDEILPGMNGEPVSEVITSQYDVIAGDWPTQKDQLVLVVDGNNEITDITLHSLGLVDTDKIIKDTLAAQRGEEIEQSNQSYSFEEIMNIPFWIIPSTDYYADTDNNGIWEDISENEDSMEVRISNGLQLKISCIVRVKEDANAILSSSLYYTYMLTDHMLELTNSSAIAIKQSDSANSNTDIFTGLPFVLTDKTEKTDAQKAEKMREYLPTLNEQEKYDAYLNMLSAPDDEAIDKSVEEYMEQYPDRASLEQLIYDQYSTAAGIDEDTIKSFIEGYNDEELREMVSETIHAMLVSQQESQAQSFIDQIAATPSAEELNTIVMQVISQLPDKNTKIGYLVSEYAKSTDMPQQNVMAYLMGLDDAALDQLVMKQAQRGAADMYAQYAGLDKAAANKKVADAFDAYYVTLSDEELASKYEAVMPPETSSSTLKDNLKLLGVQDEETPTSIYIYASTFEDKDSIAQMITDYNNGAPEEDKIVYTDIVGLIMSSVTTIINAISYVLIAFVSISLVVSSIMIGIITYISVLERTKEIGVLRAIGASKKDISRVFNAETLIIGFTAGAIGIIATVLLCIPANAIIRSLSGIETLTAFLPWQGALVLMLVSIVLTVIAGLFPSKIAAKKDPVVALRSE